MRASGPASGTLGAREGGQARQAIPVGRGGGLRFCLAASAEGERDGDGGKYAETEAPEGAEAQGAGDVGTHEGDGGNGLAIVHQFSIINPGMAGPQPPCEK